MGHLIRFCSHFVASSYSRLASVQARPIEPNNGIFIFFLKDLNTKHGQMESPSATSQVGLSRLRMGVCTLIGATQPGKGNPTPMSWMPLPRLLTGVGAPVGVTHLSLRTRCGCVNAVFFFPFYACPPPLFSISPSVSEPSFLCRTELGIQSEGPGDCSLTPNISNP